MLWHIGNFTIHGKTMVMTWLVMAIIIIVCLLGVRKLTSGKPGKMQNFLEWIMDFVSGLMKDNMPYEKGRPVLPYLCTLIFFIFVSNIFGLLPNITFNLFEHFHVEFGHLDKIFEGAPLMSPTADINVTATLAVFTISLVFILGIKNKGLGYFRHFIEPFPPFAVIHMVDVISKPMTLAFRLFGNIFAGEVLIKVILMIPGIWVLGGALPTMIWLGFSTFIGAIQAFVFTVLTIVYLGQAVETEH